MEAYMDKRMHKGMDGSMHAFMHAPHRNWLEKTGFGESPDARFTFKGRRRAKVERFPLRMKGRALFEKTHSWSHYGGARS